MKGGTFPGMKGMNPAQVMRQSGVVRRFICADCLAKKLETANDKINRRPTVPDKRADAAASGRIFGLGINGEKHADTEGT